jgi:uncharacterized membrane protein SpoIIM required for sporulation
LTPRSTRFRREREGRWLELETLVQQAESKGLTGLAAEDLRRLPALYRGLISSLSVARAISLDQGLSEYLHALAARAFVVVYGTREGLWSVVRRFMARGFPGAVRALKWECWIAGGLLALGVACGFALTAEDPERFYSFVSAGMAGGRGPTSTCAELEATLYDTGAADQLSVFAAQLFDNNAGIGLAAFATGFAAGIPSALLMFTNGLTLGAFEALFAGCGLLGPATLWMAPHGVTELLAAALCGGAGISLGRAMLLPGDYTRRAALAAAGRRAGQVALGCIGLFVIAGLIEGFFRQLVADPLSRGLMAASTALLWTVYFGFVGRDTPGEGAP